MVFLEFQILTPVWREAFLSYTILYEGRYISDKTSYRKILWDLYSELSDRSSF